MAVVSYSISNFARCFNCRVRHKVDLLTASPHVASTWQLRTEPAVQESRTPVSLLFAGFFQVEPRGFEPLTSAVQSQRTIIAGVRPCSKIPAKQSIRFWHASRLFTVVRVGWCTTGVRQTKVYPTAEHLTPLTAGQCGIRVPPSRWTSSL
jgi:hypothetical protein